MYNIVTEESSHRLLCPPLINQAEIHHSCRGAAGSLIIRLRLWPEPPDWPPFSIHRRTPCGSIGKLRPYGVRAVGSIHDHDSLASGALFFTTRQPTGPTFEGSGVEDCCAAETAAVPHHKDT